MAEEETPREERTEEASPRKLRQAWEDGNVPVSRDAIAWSALAASLAAVIASSHAWKDALTGLVVHALETADRTPFVDLGQHAASTGRLALAACGAAAVAAIGTAAAQTRAGFWPERALPDPSRLFQGGRLTRLFRREGLADLGSAFLKVAAVSLVIWFAVKGQFATGISLFDAPPTELLTRSFSPLAASGARVLGILAALAGLDFWITHRRFSDRMKMTKQELKQDMKQEDGDPLVRTRRRRKHRELAKARVVTAVPRADAVIVNPTHVAVAIRYRKDEGGAPRVIAKGKGQLAEIIRDIARSNGIPIIEDIPLARLLHRRVKIGGQIPADTYKAVAAILAFVYRMTGIRPGGVARR